VDDTQDQLLGGVVGCDGIFSTARDLRKAMLELRGGLEFSDLIIANSTRPVAEIPLGNFYCSLALGEKRLGWEHHGREASYAQAIWSPALIEKAGGGGAFISLCLETQKFFIYLTNHGRPDPFTEDSWNGLVRSIDPQQASALAFG
jgi:hypothetical protein